VSFLTLSLNLNGLAPEYITDLISRCQSSRSPRSNDQLLLMVPRSRLVIGLSLLQLIGSSLIPDSATSQERNEISRSKSDVVRLPRLWNDLPLSIKSCLSLGVFQSALKTYLFSLAFDNPL